MHDREQVFLNQFLGTQGVGQQAQSPPGLISVGCCPGATAPLLGHLLQKQAGHAVCLCKKPEPRGQLFRLHHVGLHGGREGLTHKRHNALIGLLVRLHRVEDEAEAAQSRLVDEFPQRGRGPDGCIARKLHGAPKAHAGITLSHCEPHGPISVNLKGDGPLVLQ